MFYLVYERSVVTSNALLIAMRKRKIQVQRLDFEIWHLPSYAGSKNNFLVAAVQIHDVIDKMNIFICKVQFAPKSGHCQGVDSNYLKV